MRFCATMKICIERVSFVFSLQDDDGTNSACMSHHNRFLNSKTMWQSIQRVKISCSSFTRRGAARSNTDKYNICTGTGDISAAYIHGRYYVERLHDRRLYVLSGLGCRKTPRELFYRVNLPTYMIDLCILSL